MPYRKSRFVSVEVEVDMDQFEDDELIEELQDRGCGFADPELFEELRVAFYLKNNDRALELSRQLCEIATGRIIP